MNPSRPDLRTGASTSRCGADEDTTLDLNDITGAQLIAGLEDGSIVFNGEEEEAEKTAGDEDEVDLSQYTGQELLDMLDEVRTMAPRSWTRWPPTAAPSTGTWPVGSWPTPMPTR